MDGNDTPYEEAGQNQLLELAKHLLLFDKCVPVIIGAEGSGKTVLAYRLERLLSRHFAIGRVQIHPGVQGAHLAERILDAFQLRVGADAIPTEASDLVSFLAANHAAPILLLVDDAHYLSSVQLQFIRQCLHLAQEQQLGMRLALLGEEQLADTVAAHFPSELFRPLRMEPLTVESAKGWFNYLREQMNEPSIPQLSERKIKRLLRASGGNFGKLEQSRSFNKYHFSVPFALPFSRVYEVRPIVSISLTVILGLFILFFLIHNSRDFLSQQDLSAHSKKQWGRAPTPIAADVFTQDLEPELQPLMVAEDVLSPPIEAQHRGLDFEEDLSQFESALVAPLEIPLSSPSDTQVGLPILLTPTMSDLKSGPKIPILSSNSSLLKDQLPTSAVLEEPQTLPVGKTEVFQLRPKLASAGGNKVAGPDIFKQRDKNRFSLQVFAADTPESVYRFLSRFELPADTAYYYFSKGGKLWYGVVVGDYQSYESAAQETKNLSAELRQLGPFPRKNSAIQQKMEAAQVLSSQNNELN